MLRDFSSLPGPHTLSTQGPFWLAGKHGMVSPDATFSLLKHIPFFLPLPSSLPPFSFFLLYWDLKAGSHSLYLPASAPWVLKLPMCATSPLLVFALFKFALPVKSSFTDVVQFQVSCCVFRTFWRLDEVFIIACVIPQYPKPWNKSPSGKWRK